MLPMIASAAVALLAQVAGPMSPAPPPVAGAGVGDPVVCKSVTETGTRFAKKECHTVAQWNEIAANGKAQAQYYQQKANGFGLGH